MPHRDSSSIMRRGILMESFMVFVCNDEDKNCAQCRQYNGRIYRINDDSKPKLPIHPHCRCRFERYSGNVFDRQAMINFFRNLPEATQIALETRYLPAGIGELIGAVKAVSMIYTEKGLWLVQARRAVRTSPKARGRITEVLLELENANCNDDFRKIIQIYNKYR